MRQVKQEVLPARQFGVIYNLKMKLNVLPIFEGAWAIATLQRRFWYFSTLLL